MIVAIDGPSGAGKSTVAKAAAKRLEALGAIARDNEIEFGHVEGDPVPRRVFISGTEVTDAIRTSEIDRAVGPVAAVPAVREALVAQQQRIGRAGDYVVEGRDIGTVVFPEAPVKVFLTASAEERATRRVKQNEERHVGSTNYEEVRATRSIPRVPRRPSSRRKTLCILTRPAKPSRKSSPSSARVPSRLRGNREMASCLSRRGVQLAGFVRIFKRKGCV